MLRTLRRELGLARRHCTTVLRSGLYQILPVDAPGVPAPEMKAAVRWQLKDLIDFPIEKATIDAIHIPGAASAQSGKMFAVAARNEAIAATVKPFHDGGLPLEAIDVPELAQRNVAHLLEDPGKGVALLVFAEQDGLLTLTCDGELYQYRRIDVSLQALAGAGDERRQQLYERIVLEVQRSLDHFDRQFSHVPVARLVVTAVPGAEDLLAHIRASIDMPVAALDLAQVLDCTRIPELREAGRQTQCLRVIGGALRSGEPRQ
jgi:MSHA biogenesis protein MshI